MAADPLAALKPLIEPEAVSWWPLAPGWWVLLGAVAGLLALAGVLLARRRQRIRRTAYRREAGSLLDQLPGEPLPRLQAIAQVLRRAAISAAGLHYGSCPWPQVAALGGKAGFSAASIALLTDSQYRREPPEADTVEQLHREAQQWLAQLPPATGNGGQPC